MRRAGFDRFLRNVLVAAGNSGEAGLAPAITACLDHESALVRGMAVWALRQLLDRDAIAKIRAIHVPNEADSDVVGEWMA